MVYRNNFLKKHQEGVMTTIMIAACLSLLVFFPANGASQQITSGIVFLFALPVLFLKFILKKDLKDFGWQLGNWRQGLFFSGIYFLAAAVIFFLLFRHTDFLKNYYLPASIQNNFWYFISYEILIVGAFAALYEIFFRGFVMFSFVPKTGFYAVFYQLFLIFLFIWTTGNLTWNNTPIILTSFFSGLTAFKSRSILYPFAASLIFFLVLDALIIRFAR